MKKILCVGTMVLAMVATCVPAFAADENIGVSPFKPGTNTGIETRTTSKPGYFETYDIASLGKYKFSGQAANESLYTNYSFIGCTAYDIQVKNLKGSNAESLDVVVYKSPAIGTDKKLKSVTVKGQITKNISISSLKTGDRVFIEFKAPSHFSGWIDEG
jgi:hypothetical protein